MENRLDRLNRSPLMGSLAKALFFDLTIPTT